MANTTKYQKTPKSKAELIAEARIRQQHKKEAEAAQTPEQKQGIPVLSDIWNFIGNVPVVGKWYATLADFSTEAFQGAVSTIEGIVDMAASVVGAFGDENFKKKVQDFIKTDFTGTYIAPLVKNTIPTEQSLITDLPEQPERIVRGVGQGIGQMAPALLAGGLGSAAGLGAKAVQAIGTGTFMAGAGGRGVQEAYQEGAGYGEGLMYGAAVGALEGAIERLTGGVGTKVFGKGLINKVIGKQAKSGLLKLAMNAAGEAFEEALSEYLNPYLKRMTYDKDAPMATKEQILESAVVGALTSIVMSGTAAADVDVEAIQNAQQEISRAWAENRTPDLTQAVKELQKLDAKTRKAILETTNLSRHIDENGNIKQVQQSEAYSPNLDESKLAYKPTTQKLTAEQQEAKMLFAQLTKGNKGLVFAEMPEGVNGAYKDGVVYVNVKANAVQEIIKHELAHSIEGTKAYNKFAKHVLQTLIDNPELAKNIKGETLEQSITKTSELYQKVLEGKELTEQQREILTEIVAQYSEKLLTDKTQIERLVNQDRSIAQRVLDWIRDKIAALKGKTKLERETIEFLRKAEKLYVEALEMPVVAKQKKYSLTDLPDIDSEGRKLTKEQQEFFKDSKVRDEQGRLLVVYHGTGNLFSEFKTSNQWGYGGAYFSTNRKVAETYAKVSKPNQIVVDAYVNLANPYIVDAQNKLWDSIARPQEIEGRGTVDTQEIARYARDNGYDGVIIRNVIEHGGAGNNVIAFSPNQIKLTTNLNPTTNKDIRYSLDKKYTQDDTIALAGAKESEKAEAKRLWKELKTDSPYFKKWFGDSKMVDSEGKPKIFFHGSKTVEQINSFDSNKSNYGGLIFFTADPTFALGWSKGGVADKFSWTEDGDILYDGVNITDYEERVTKTSRTRSKLYGGNVYPVYLKVEKPFDFFESEAQKQSLYDHLVAKGFSANEAEDITDRIEADHNFEAREIPEVVEWLKSNGYDGIWIKEEDSDNDYQNIAVFSPNQIKSATGNIGTFNPKTTDIRYSLKDKRYTQDDTISLKPTKQDKFYQKSYTQKEAATIIQNILNEMSLETHYAELRGASKQEAVKTLWKALNTKQVGQRSKAALDIAEYILNNAVAVDILANDTVMEATATLDTLRSYLRSIDLTNLQEEIRRRYDSAKSINLLWGKKGGIGADELPRLLASEGIQIKATNDADILFEVHELYKNTQKLIKNAADKKLAEVFKKEELKDIKSQIAQEILRSYDEFGTETAFTKQLNKYAERISKLKDQLKETREIYKAETKLKNTIDRVEGLEKFKGANEELTELVAGLVKTLSKTKTYWGNLSKNIREPIRTYKKLYAELTGSTEAELLTDPVYKMITDIAEGEGKLTLDEMRNLNTVLEGFIENARNYRKIFFEGKKQDALDVATRTIEELKKTKKVASTGFKGLWNRLRHWLESPSARFERLGLYGLTGETTMKSLWDSFVEAEQRQAAFLRDAHLLYADFFAENKKYMRDLYKTKVKFAGKEITKGQAITLYLLSKRQQTISHIYNIDQESGKIRVTKDKHDNPHKAFMQGEDIIFKKSDIDALELTETDKKFIELTRKFFNELAANAKEETDIQNYGVTNVSRTGDYIPVRVSSDELYSRAGDPDMFLDLFNVYNPSFNKEVKPNAKNKVVVENIYDVVNRHARQMSVYVGYSTPIRTYNRIMNMQTGDATVKQVLMEIDPDFQQYVNKLLKDAQGIRQHREGFDRFLSKIRGMGARAALGLTPKVVITQYVSLFASKGVGVEYKNILKGAKKAMKATKADYDLMYKYVPMTWVRANSGFNAEIGFIKESQGIIGTTNKWLDKTTALIEKVDSWVVFAVWNAALEQTKSQYTPFSEEHYKAAAKLTHESVVKTQANYIPLYRPEILRSQSSFLQLATMFMSEPLQQFSQAVEAIDKIIVADYITKNSKDADVIANAKRIRKQALTQAKNTFTMLTVNSVLLVAITQAFKYLLGKQDEEDPLGDIGNDFLGIVTGMFPFVRDIHSYLEGYDITNMYYTGLTTIATAFKDAASLLGGDTENTARNMRRTLIGVSQIFGIPLRNLETYAKGIIGLFSPSAKYKYEDLFYQQSYAKDLQKAVEKGNDKLADTIIDLMLNDKGIGKTDEKARAEILKLYAQGESVLPSGVPKTVNINGEERKLTEAERRQITNIYSQADMTKLVNMPEYSKLTSTQKARAIKIVYDIYKDKAFSSVLGLDISKRALFAYAIEPSIIAYVLAVVGEMEGDKKLRIQQLINKLDIPAAQKYMLMGLLGYKNKNGAGIVRAYINRLDLTRTEKQSLYEHSGY